MKECTREEFEAALQWGDIGLVRGKSLSMAAQDIQRKVDNVDEKASHAVISKGGGVISEADGKKVTAKNPLSRYYSDHHKMWFFRSLDGFSDVERARGEGYLMNEEQVEYGKGGIWEFVKEVFFEKILRKPYVPKDKIGIFCSEHDSRFAIATNRYWVFEIVNGVETPVPPERVTPSLLLEWMFEVGVPRKRYALVASYDCGKFFVY